MVATDRISPRQQAMYVSTDLDEALVAHVSENTGLRLVLLTGSAGGGKSALIRQLQSRLPQGTISRVVEDATHADSPSERQTERLAGVLAGFSNGVPPAGDLTVIAANTGLLLELHREFTERGQPALADVIAYALHVLGVPGKRSLTEARREELGAAVLVVDLDQRPTSGGEGRLLRRMLAGFHPDLPGGVLAGAARCGTCAVKAWCAPRTNAELLADPQIGAALDEAVEQIAMRRGRDVAPRQLWDGVSELALGGISAEGDPCNSVAGLAGEKDGAAVWQALLPNGVFGWAQGALAREIQALDPSFRASSETHTVIASAGILPAEDARMLEDLLGSADGEARQAVTTAASALAASSAGEGARGLVRAHWLMGRLPLGPVVPEEFKEAVSMQDDAREQVIQVVSDGLVQAFGQTAERRSYLPTESLGESRDARVLVQVDVDEHVEVLPQRAQHFNRQGSRVVGLRPLTARLKIGKSVIDLDLPLYRLLQMAAEGALPATVDIERFHALRYAAERLGRQQADNTDLPLLVTDDARGTAFVVTPRHRRGQEQLKIEKVA
ncbi:hypothetical protein OHO83_08825 [Streptomyces sp. NBC_00569]|uniref:hypothetical protein n=1 Tax=Streptomyces sp. NBC_00569 TaxID=2975780 RepID=UPI002E811FEE|nr:hypothetical protein [Streptomyces sp. NBC_00569]WUB92410.1 hypothetical protein OHO83_08825 [Streptomyces sp. NBC_00569]